MMRSTLIGLLVVIPSLSFAVEPKAAPSPEAKKSVPSLGLGDVGKPIPKGDGVKAPVGEKLGAESAVKVQPNATYDVVSVQHAKGFKSTANGHVSVGPLLAGIHLNGHPPSTETFTTLLKVHSASKQNAPIDVMILDPRGDTAMSSSGELRFNGKDSVGYTVDWDSVPARSAGKFQVLVRIAGQPLGTWPLEVVGSSK